MMEGEGMTRCEVHVGSDERWNGADNGNGNMLWVVGTEVKRETYHINLDSALRSYLSPFTLFP
jgi:hypothetical protein